MAVFFYAKAYIWHCIHRNIQIKTVEEAFEYFYISFLKVPPQDIRILDKTETSMTVACSHDCPILDMAIIMGKDTRIVCQRVSKGPCLYFIRKLGRDIEVANTYNHIRPHEDAYIETICVKTNSNVIRLP